MRAALAIMFFCLAAPGPGLAGAWLRGEGETFLSVTGTLRETASDIGLETDIYLEHGLGPRLTAGLVFNDNGVDSGHALAFLRLPLGPMEGASRFSLELGLGAHHFFDAWRPMQKVTLAYGRGLSWEGGSGWLSLDAAVEHRQGLPDPDYKLDLTLGQSGGAKLRPMLKLGTTYAPGLPLGWTASAHMLIDGPKDVTWSLGVERKRAGQLSTALVVGVWRRF